MIHYKNVTKTYPKGTVSLDDINLTIDEGEFVSLVGHSGAGKTTMIKLLLAEEKPSEGEIFFLHQNVHKLSKHKLNEFRRRIGVVFQDFKLLPNKTAYENISFAMEASGKSDAEIRADVPHVLSLVELGDRAKHFPHQMSGGEKQRLAIARAIINQPEVIIADEPTGNLDPISTYEVVQILKKINDLGTTIILTTHNKGVVESIGKRVITLEKGKIIRDESDGKYVI